MSSNVQHQCREESPPNLPLEGGGESDGYISTDVDTIIAPTSKKRRLEQEPAATGRGSRSAKVKALRNAVWLNAGVPTGRAPPRKGPEHLPEASKKRARGGGKVLMQPQTYSGSILASSKKGHAVPKGQFTSEFKAPLTVSKAIGPGRKRHATDNLDSDPIVNNSDHDATVTYQDESCNRDDAHDTDYSDHDKSDSDEEQSNHESDDPELIKPRPVLSAKLAAERPLWVKPKMKVTEHGLHQKSRRTSNSGKSSSGVLASVGNLPAGEGTTSETDLAASKSASGSMSMPKPAGTQTNVQSHTQAENQPLQANTVATQSPPALPSQPSHPSNNNTVTPHGFTAHVAGNNGLQPSMNLIYSASGDVHLTVQVHEIRAVVRKAIALMTANLIFIDGYPDSATRTAWARKVLISSANALGAIQRRSPNSPAPYDIIQYRLRQDNAYLSALSKMLDGRVSIFRNNLKTSAVPTVVLHYGLKAGCADDVDFYSSKMRYIYPCDAKTQKVDVQRPYQNPAIAALISIHYFARSAIGNIIHEHEHRFNPNDPVYTELELPDAMIASAATALYASILEWRNGTHQHHEFSANAFADVYQAHRSNLAAIFRANPRAYHDTKAKLYRTSRANHASATALQNEATGLLNVMDIRVD